VKIVSKSPHKQYAAAWDNKVYEFLKARQDDLINITSTDTKKVSPSISISAQKLQSTSAQPKYTFHSLKETKTADPRCIVCLVFRLLYSVSTDKLN
jgi:hypothetical protein